MVDFWTYLLVIVKYRVWMYLQTFKYNKKGFHLPKVSDENLE